MKANASSTSLVESSKSKKGKLGVFSSLLHSARKSTESLRSFRTSTDASRQNVRRGWIADQDLDPPPPLPQPRDHRSMDVPAASRSVLSLASVRRDPNTGSASLRQSPSFEISSRQSNGHAAFPLPQGDEMAEDSLPPLLSEMVPASRVASRAGSHVSHSSRQKVNSSALAGVASRRDDHQDAEGAKTPTGRTTPTQRNPQGEYGGVPAVPTKEGDGNTVAQLYIVAGLPKDPAVWTLAEEDCVAGVHHMEGAVGRFWRPEILGCSICPSPAELAAKQKAEVSSSDPRRSSTDAEQKWEGRTSDGSKTTASNPKFIEMTGAKGRIERAETAKVLSKALKLSFTREVEIVSGQSNFPPASSSHTYSFTVPTQISVGGGSAAYGQQASNRSSANTGKRDSGAWNAGGEGAGNSNGANPQNPGFEDSLTPMTFYGVVLTVWSAADERRTKAIKKELNRAAKARKNKKGGNGGNNGDADDDDGFLPANNAFFMPYAISIVSKWPLYDLLGDWNKWAWNRYSRNIQKHNQLMSAILATPAPRLGTTLTVDSPDGDIAFSCTFPGALEWGTGQIAVNLTMWPLFKALSIDNILTICEVALAPNGRILFMSRYPALLGLAVETIKYLVEMCGWKATALQCCHARDVKIYLEDPGSWIIAIASELRSIVRPAKEVCVVDLDINFVKLSHPPRGAPSTKGLREKRKRKLVQALGYSSGDFRPPREYVEAYPGGRFRPLSKMIVQATASADEQLEQPIWWDQPKIIAGFDKALHDGSRPSPLVRLLRMRAAKNYTSSEAELAALAALRTRADTFVDARDGLENKIGRLNKRLAFLMSESEMWKVQFAKISQLVERLTKEANETRAKLDKERRESKRLSSTLAQRDMERFQLEIQLRETEEARIQAQGELNTMQRAMDSLEHEREAMMNEIRGIVSGAGGEEDIAFNTSRMDLYNESVSHASGVSSPTGSHASITPSQAAERILSARKAAEDRINEGAPNSGRSRARTASIAHSETAPRGKLSSPLASTLGGHQSMEDQMNYDIHRRTLTVTNQIARIQAQLENTLSSLEDRKSVSHHGRRKSGRTRRDSDLSMDSTAQYELRAPSSLGGGHMTSDVEGAQSSASRCGLTDDVSTEIESVTHDGGYGSTASVGRSGSDARRRERRDARRQRASAGSVGGPAASAASAASTTIASQQPPNDVTRRRVGSITSAAPPSAYRGPLATALPAGKASSAPAIQYSRDNWQPHQQLQEREKENAWKQSTDTIVSASPTDAAGPPNDAMKDLSTAAASKKAANGNGSRHNVGDVEVEPERESPAAPSGDLTNADEQSGGMKDGAVPGVKEANGSSSPAGETTA